MSWSAGYCISLCQCNSRVWHDNIKTRFVLLSCQMLNASFFSLTCLKWYNTLQTCDIAAMPWQTCRNRTHFNISVFLHRDSIPAQQQKSFYSWGVKHNLYTAFSTTTTTKGFTASKHGESPSVTVTLVGHAWLELVWCQYGARCRN